MMKTIRRHLPAILIGTAALILDASVYAASDWVIAALPVSLQLALWGLLLWSSRNPADDSDNSRGSW